MTPSNPTNSQPLIYRIADALGVFHLVAPVDHHHSQDEIDGLETALAGMMPLKTIDSAPANNADHLVSSKGVYTALAGKSNTDHTHDHIILAGVGRMGVSEDTETKDGYVWVVLWDDTQETEVTYLIKKDDLLKWLNPDSTPTTNSTKFVTSGGVKTALDEKADLLHTHNQSQILGMQKDVTLSESTDRINISSDIVAAGSPRHIVYYIKNATGNAINLSDFISEGGTVEGGSDIAAGAVVVMSVYVAFARIKITVEQVF